MGLGLGLGVGWGLGQALAVAGARVMAEGREMGRRAGCWVEGFPGTC